MEDEVFASCELRGKDGGKVRVRLYTSGDVVFKNENDDLVIMDEQQLRVLRHLLAVGG